MTVGEFTYEKDGTVTGPAQYMADRFDKFRANLEAGRNAVFNYGAMHGKGTAESLLLVALQTDYAAWKGMESFRRAK
jgi:hypothetical protein